MGIYKPKKSRLDQNRIEKLITELIADCKKDRTKIYETIEDFKAKLHETNIVEYADNIVKCLEAVHDVNDKILKLIEIGAKIAIKEIDAELKTKSKTNPNGEYTFENLQEQNS